MNTAVITIKVRPEIKKKAQQLSAELGLSLSSLVKGFLNQLLKTKTVTFSAADETPSDYMIQALKESAQDIKAGRVTSFENPKDAVKFLDTMIKNERKTKKN